jgi:hypothetical protein
MNREQILNVFRSLACSQGFYGRLLHTIDTDPEWGEEFLSNLEAQNFGSDLDLILYIEG